MTGASTLSDLILRWHRGWALARGQPPVEHTPDGLRVRYGTPGLRMEFIAVRADADPDSVRRLAAQAATMPDTVLTVPTTSASVVRAVLAGAGLVVGDDTEALMSRPLGGHPDPGPPASYRTVVTATGATVGVRVLHSSGVAAARGRAVLAGGDAVPVDITTAPDHRRRGLGSVVMGALAARAVDAGAGTGVLVASPNGRQLYAALGWTWHADVLVARSRA